MPASGWLRRLGRVAALSAATGLLSAAPAHAAPATRALPAPRLPSSFLLTPTDQLGFPGSLPGTLVTPEGSLYTGWAELGFQVGGTTLDPRSHTLADGRYPIVQAFRVAHGVLYRLSAFQTFVAGTPVTFARIEITNLSSSARRARVVAGVRHDGGELGPRGERCCVRIYRFPRPRAPQREGLYNQPGAPFNAGSTYSFAGRALLRDGAALVFYPSGGPRTRMTQTLNAGPNPVVPRTQFGRTTYEMSLRPRERRALDFTMPVVPVAQGDARFGTLEAARFAPYRASTRAFWRRLLGGAMQVSLPEAKVEDAFYASIAQDALARYTTAAGTWVQAVNQLRYHSFYLRDGAVITNMYDLVGLHRLARENLEFFFTWQRDDGLFISRPQEYDGFGQALWSFGEHYRRTGDRAFAQRAFPAVRRAMDWFERQTASDPLGLMPPVETSFDNELVSGHLAGDNFWAVDGVSRAIDIARAVGDGAAAERWSADLADFKSRLAGAVSRAAAQNGGTIPPSLDVRGGQDWGNLWAAYPRPGLYRADDPLVRRTMDRVRRFRFREGIATYADRRLLHHYLGFRVFETDLLAGRQDAAVRGLYSELAHTTGTHAGFEAGTAPFGDRIVDDATVPHGWYAAEYVALVRNMLVRESGSDVYLMSALSPSWLKAGRRVSVRGAPTDRGSVSYTLTATSGGAVLRWSSRLAAGTRLRWPVPAWARGVRAPGLNRRLGLITLRGRAGRIRVSWRLAGPSLTYDLTFRRLMDAYLRSPSGAVEQARALRAQRDARRASRPEDLNRSVAP